MESKQNITFHSGRSVSNKISRDAKGAYPKKIQHSNKKGCEQIRSDVYKNVSTEKKNKRCTSCTVQNLSRERKKERKKFTEHFTNRWHLFSIRDERKGKEMQMAEKQTATMKFYPVSREIYHQHFPRSTRKHCVLQA